MALVEKEKPASARTRLGTGENQEPDTLPPTSNAPPPHGCGWQVQPADPGEWVAAAYLAGTMHRRSPDPARLALHSYHPLVGLVSPGWSSSAPMLGCGVDDMTGPQPGSGWG